MERTTALFLTSFQASSSGLNSGEYGGSKEQLQSTSVAVHMRSHADYRATGFVHPRIEGHPGVKQPQLADWMARCAIFALPSRTEAMGRVLVEAGAAAKCRLATRVDGIPTVIENGVDGVLVDTENVDQLARALEQLMRDASLRQRLGQGAKRRVERDFSDEAYLDHYAELVSVALDRGVA